MIKLMKQFLIFTTLLTLLFANKNPIYATTIDIDLASQCFDTLQCQTEIALKMSIPSIAEETPYNYFIFSSYFGGKSHNTSLIWEQPTKYLNLVFPHQSNSDFELRNHLISLYHSKEKKILLQLFGQYSPYSEMTQIPNQICTDAGQYAREIGYDGVDVFFTSNYQMIVGDGTNFLLNCQDSLRQNLINGTHLVIHEVQAPWFTTNTAAHKKGNYLKINALKGNSIDFYLVQFWGWGPDFLWETYEDLFSKSSYHWFSKTSVKEIIQSGIPSSKLILGKSANIIKVSENSVFQFNNLANWANKATKEFKWIPGFHIVSFNSDLKSEKISIIDEQLDKSMFTTRTIRSLASNIASVLSPKMVTYVNSLKSWWPNTAIASSIGVPTYSNDTFQTTDYPHNVVILSFYLEYGAFDAALVFSDCNNPSNLGTLFGNTASESQIAIAQRFHSKGKKLILGAFGATSMPTTSNYNANTLCTTIANHAKNNHYDGVDLDWEDFDAYWNQRAKAVQWLIDCTNAIRVILPVGQYILTHAPIAPWFGVGGGYRDVHNAVGDKIDWYNIQYYNQGDSNTLETYSQIFETFNGASVNELLNMHLTSSIRQMMPEQIVVGKPATKLDESAAPWNRGYVAPATLAKWGNKAKSVLNWSPGFMTWQFISDISSSFMKTLNTNLCTATQTWNDATQLCSTSGLICDSSCLSCSGTSTYCTNCATGMYLTSTNTCTYCNSICKTCLNLATSCTSCNAGYYLNGSSCQILTITCLSGQYVLNGACASCNSSCKECQNTSTSCLSCNSGYYLSSSSCIVCPNGCATCTGSNICLTCLTGYTLSNSLCQATTSTSVNFAQAIHPKLITYIDSLASWWPNTAIAQSMAIPSFSGDSFTTVDTPHNVIIYSVYIEQGPWDVSLVFSNPTNSSWLGNLFGSTNDAAQIEIVRRFHSKGKKLLLSAFGGGINPTSNGYNAKTLCGTIAQHVKNNHYDGLDINWEDINAYWNNRAVAVQWLIDCTNKVREILPQGQYIVTHAPVAPWFSIDGGYRQVHDAVGDKIDWYNIQYYNQGDSLPLETYAQIFTSQNGASIQELMQMHTQGHRQMYPEQIVLGKPASLSQEAAAPWNRGYVAPVKLAKWANKAKLQFNWVPGFMSWQYIADKANKYMQNIQSTLCTDSQTWDISSGTCIASTLICDVSCKTCDTISTNCTSCIDGKYLSAGICQVCNSSCKTCAIIASQCTSCQVGYILQGSICQANTISCADGTYLLNGICANCNTTCKTCSGSSTQCLSCHTDSYLSGNICITCPVGCSSCTSNTICQTCNVGYTFSANLCVQNQAGTVNFALELNPKKITYLNRLSSWWPNTAIAQSMAIPTTSSDTFITKDTPHNVIIYTVYLETGPWDAALVFDKPTSPSNFGNLFGTTDSASQLEIVKRFHDKGKKLMLSAFGGGVNPTSNGYNANILCGKIAQYVKDNHYDGLDIDWEDIDAYWNSRSQAVQWLIDCTNKAREILPQGQYILTHAPIAPWFNVGGGYRDVHNAVGDIIDWYNLQYYNQGNDNPCETYDQVFKTFNGASVQELLNMHLNGSGMRQMKPEQIVVGKPSSISDEAPAPWNRGYVTPNVLANWGNRAKTELNWIPSFMTWQYASDIQNNYMQQVSQNLCQSNQAYNVTSGVCQLQTTLTCDASCLTCQTTPSKCTSCIEGKFLNSNNQCINCDSNCKACSGSSVSCTSCKAGYLLNASNCDLIIISCSNGQFLINNQCLPCSTNCQTCQQTENNCLSCNTGYQLNGTICQVTSCIDGQYLSSNICQPCAVQCKTCANNANTCLSCSSGYILINNSCQVQITSCQNGKYLSNNSCLDCNINCATCETTATKCLTCQSGYILAGNICNVIVTNCPVGQYLINNICASCSATCASCIDSATNCLSCPPGSYLNGSVCVIQIQCSDGYYLQNQTCISCPSNCKTCSSDTICNSCYDGLYLSSNQCLRCSQGCAKCTSPTNCTPAPITCIDGQYLDSLNICQPCDKNCLTCSSSATHCTACPRLYYLDNHVCLKEANFCDPIKQYWDEANQYCACCDPICSQGCSGSPTSCVINRKESHNSQVFNDTLVQTPAQQNSTILQTIQPQRYTFDDKEILQLKILVIVVIALISIVIVVFIIYQIYKIINLRRLKKISLKIPQRKHSSDSEDKNFSHIQEVSHSGVFNHQCSDKGSEKYQNIHLTPDRPRSTSQQPFKKTQGQIEQHADQEMKIIVSNDKN